MVQRLAGPKAVPANQLAQEVGVHQSTLSRWLRDAQHPDMGTSNGTEQNPPASTSAKVTATMLATLQWLGVVPSYSRPRVSNDNPFSEALFRTLKYQTHLPYKPFATRDEAFVRGTDGALWHTWEHTVNGAWSGWATLGGGVHDPFVSSDADGRLVVFVRGDGAGALYRIAQIAPNGGWGSWEGMGGAVSGAPIAARNKDGRQEVFFRATNGSVQHSWEGAPEDW